MAPQSQNYTLTNLFTTNLTTPLPTELTTPILSSPPFIVVPGTFNFREMSNTPLISNSSIKHNYAFRSGSLERLTLEGHQVLLDLGIKKIFDLRSKKEVGGFPSANIEGIEVVWTPSTLDNETTIQAQREEVKQGDFSFVGMYMPMLETHRDAFRQVLLHVRDHPDHPFLFHCTAGKDRTGVMACLLLMLADEEDANIDLNNLLTRIGIEPARELLMTKLLNGRPIDMNDERLKAYTQMPLTGMSDFKKAIENKYGHPNGYFIQELQLSEEDIVTIKKNLKT